MKKMLMFMLTLVSLNVLAQGGVIKGNVVDGTTNEALIGAIVLVEGTENAAMTDYMGNFQLHVEAGYHNIEVRMEPSYKIKVLPKISVLAGGVHDCGVIKMSTANIEIGVTTIVIESETESEGGAMDVQKNKTEIADVMSSAEITKTGAPDAAAAVKAKPGVSVVGGKYVYIRGLGDRYNKTTLNGLDVPGLDPDRNAVQMDIFPSNVIGGLSVSKSFIASMPADFTGGIIDIKIKSPKKYEAGLSTSLGYVPTMHFNSDYLTYDRQGGDVLASGASDREMPDYATYATDNPGLMSQFDPILAPYKTNSLLDYSLGGHYGNKKILNKGSLSYNVAMSYSEKTRFYEDAEQNRFALATDADNTTLITRSTQKGDFGTNEVLISALGGLKYKLTHNTYDFSAIRLQNGQSSAGVYDFDAPTNNPYSATQYNLEYNERTLTNLFLGGKHTFSDSSKWELEWKLSPTFSSMDDPDVRSTRFNLSNSTPYGTEAGLPSRIWRSMYETNYAGKVDLTKQFKFNDTIAKLQFGVATTLKARDFQVQSYQILAQSPSLLGLGEDPNEIFMDQNILDNSAAPANAGFWAGQPTSYSSSDPNRFNSTSKYFAGYVSSELMLMKKLQAIVGVRVEQFSINYTGYNANAQEYEIKEEVLNSLDFFPALGFTYSVNKDQKVRFSATKTIARPSFKEMSFATIIDPVSGITFLGGKNAIDSWDGDLTKTDIYNGDVRWELYMKKAQTFSVSSFYKYFVNPIEIIQIAGASENFQPRNVGNATVFGAEFEGKKRLGFLSKKLEQFVFNFNYTYTTSRVEMSDMVRESKELNARTGEDVGKYRDMAGQSPYLINSGFAYEGAKDSSFFANLKVGIYYNVQGKTLQYVGVTERPDVYSNPFHSLNLTASKQFGKELRYKISIKATNLLNDIKEKVYVSYNTDDNIFSSLTPAQSFKLGFSMKF